MSYRVRDHVLSRLSNLCQNDFLGAGSIKAVNRSLSFEYSARNHPSLALKSLMISPFAARSVFAFSSSSVKRAGSSLEGDLGAK
jgi:hypothetical protein